MVHADLRPKNIMVAVNGKRGMTSELVLKVIDLDWAGMVVRYAIRHYSTLISNARVGPKVMRKLVKVMTYFSSIIGGARLFGQRNPLSFNDLYVLP